MMRPTKLVAALLGACLCSFSALAEIYYSTPAASSGAAAMGPKSIIWTQADGTVLDPQPTPAANDGNDYVFETTMKLSSGTFEGKAFLGSLTTMPAGAVEKKASLSSNYGTFKFSDCTLVNGRWGMNASGVATFAGSYTIADGCSFAFYGQNNGSTKFTDGSDNQRRVAFGGAATLAGAADTTLTYYFTLSTAKSAVGETLVSGLTVSCDASAFKGRYYAYSPGTASGRYQHGYLKLTSATAFGDPTGNETAVELGCDTTLELTADVQQYATRKVVLNPGSDKVAGVRAMGSDSWTLTAPMELTSGSFVKRNPGTVVMNGPYTVSGSGVATMTVEEGTLVLGKDGTFPAGLAVTVKSGAKLVQNAFIPGIAVTCEDGGTYEKDYQYDVAYDAATDACRTLDFTAETLELPVSLKLTEQMTFPFHTAKRLEVAKLPADTTATAEDFSDITEKSYDLPRTSFEVEDRVGYKALVLVARPVVVSTRNFKDADGGVNAPTSTESPWSDGNPVGPDRDYLMLHELQRTGATPFAGGSLTFAKTSIQLRHPDATSLLDKAVVYSGSIWPNHGSLRNAVLSGELTVMGDFGASSGVNFSTRWSNANSCHMRLNLSAALKGVGTTLYALNFNGGTARKMELEISGDNSEYGGCMLVEGYSGAVEGNEMELVINDPKNLGGPLTTSTGHALRLRNFALVKPTASMTLETRNRCVQIMDKGGFLTPEDVELTIRQKVWMSDKSQLYKKGAGTLSLGGGLRRDGKGDVFVREGFVKVLADASVEGLDWTFSDGAGLALDPTAGLTYGLRGTIGTANAEDKIVLKLGAVPAEGTTTAAVPVCTVAAGSADLTDKLTFVRSVKGWRGIRVVKSDVTINDVACTTYTAEFATSGFLVIVR